MLANFKGTSDLRWFYSLIDQRPDQKNWVIKKNVYGISLKKWTCAKDIMTESKFEEHNIKASILESFLSISFKLVSFIYMPHNFCTIV